jgi:hypothetical protein
MSEMETPALLKLDADKIFVLHELYLTKPAMELRGQIKERLQKEGGNANEN